MWLLAKSGGGATIRSLDLNTDLLGAPTPVTSAAVSLAVSRPALSPSALPPPQPGPWNS